MSHLKTQLEYADYVSKTFEWQTKEERINTVTQLSYGDRSLCPVCLETARVIRIRGYPGSTGGTPTIAVWRNDRIEHVISSEMVEALRAAAVGAIKDEILEITKDKANKSRQVLSR